MTAALTPLMQVASTSPSVSWDQWANHQRTAGNAGGWPDAKEHHLKLKVHRIAEL